MDGCISMGSGVAVSVDMDIFPSSGWEWVCVGVDVGV